MLSMIQGEVVTRYGWVSSQEFTDIVAISQMTPGPIGINAATYVGFTSTGSIWGSIIATFAVVLPSFILMPVSYTHLEEDVNPVVSIHDHGSAGHVNCLSELVEECGGLIDMSKLPIGDKTLSAKEIIANESQERMGLLIKEDVYKRQVSRYRAN